MKIVLICPFHNEKIVAGIQIEESLKWVDKIYITEANRTFQYGEKQRNYDLPDVKNVFYTFENVERVYKSTKKFFPNIDLQRKFRNKLFFFNSAWYNEMMQRYLAVENADFDDNDLLILCDIDEIIDARLAETLVSFVQKTGIATVKMHMTYYCFNLFGDNIVKGPDMFSYRLFLVKGHIFRKKWKNNYDKLRKMGESGQLIQEIPCFPEVAGFHHSWLGDEHFIKEKLLSYAHTEYANLSDIDVIKKKIKNRESIYNNDVLCLKPDINLLESVENKREKLSNFFLNA